MSHLINSCKNCAEYSFCSYRRLFNMNEEQGCVAYTEKVMPSQMNVTDTLNWDAVNNQVISGNALSNLISNSSPSIIRSKWSFGKNYEIKSITVNKEKQIVTVVFADGGVEMTKCCEEDKKNFDVNIGVALAIAKHLYGSKNRFHKEVVKKTRKGTRKNEKKKQN